MCSKFARQLHGSFNLPIREFCIDNLLVRIHCIIVMIVWTGLAPWEFELPFPGSLTSTFLEHLWSYSRQSLGGLQGYLAHKKTPNPLGPP